MNFKLKMVSAAVVCAFGLAHQANALTIVGNSPTTLATEQLPAVGAITLNNIGVNSTTQGVVSGNPYSISFTLTNGATWNTAGLLVQINQNTLAPFVTELYTSALSVGNTVLTYSIIGTAGVNTSAANTFFQLSGAIINGAGAALIATGVNDNGCGFTTGTISVTARYFAANGTEVDLNPGGNTGTVVVAGQAVTGAITPTANPVLDVLTTVRPAAAPAASKFARTLNNGTVVNVLDAPIGTFRFSDVAGLQGSAADPTLDYRLGVAVPAVSVSASDNGATLGVTASAGFGTGSSLYLIDDTANTACTADPSALPAIAAGAVIALPAPVVTGTGAVTRTYTIPLGGITSVANRARTYTICYRLSGTAGNVPQSQFSGYAIQNRIALTDVADYAAGPSCPAPLARATINGGVIFIRNYSPAAANAFGWNQQIRIINSGSVATPITAYFVYADGSTSATSTIVPNIAAGGSVTLFNTAIEALMGISPPLSASNPRLVITGNTNSLRAQNYIVQPGGNWVEASGGQDDGAGPAGTQN